MAITEVENARREKSGEEKFDIIVSQREKSAYGDQCVNILQSLYTHSANSSFLKIPMEESTTRVALVMLVEHGLIKAVKSQPFQPKKFAITSKGERLYELLFLRPSPTLH